MQDGYAYYAYMHILWTNFKVNICMESSLQHWSSLHEAEIAIYQRRRLLYLSATVLAHVSDIYKS